MLSALFGAKLTPNGAFRFEKLTGTPTGVLYRMNAEHDLWQGGALGAAVTDLL